MNGESAASATPPAASTGIRDEGRKAEHHATYAATARPPSIGWVDAVSHIANAATTQRCRSTAHTTPKNAAVAQRNEYWPPATASMKNGLAMNSSISHGSRSCGRTIVAPTATATPARTRKSVTDQSPSTG